VLTLTPDRAAALLVELHGLTAPLGEGDDGVRRMLAHRRAIQLDPLDVIGTNADLVAHARVDGVVRGQVYDALLPGHAFEHWAKERCLLPAERFPHWRERAGEVDWWRVSERMTRIDAGLVEDVYNEIAERGPLAPAELSDRGRVTPMDWSGWKGTPRAATMAVEVLWTSCRIVVARRTATGKWYDIPERVLPAVAGAPATGRFEDVALPDRVTAAGFLPRPSGPWWGLLDGARKGLADELVAKGVLDEVRIAGSRRTWLVHGGAATHTPAEPDDRMRILGPLDPLLWDRALVKLAFGFDYVWEVYKPAHQRRWGWYVCPLLHRGKLVGRIEARAEAGKLNVVNVWPEAGRKVDKRALAKTIARHEAFLKAP
jgi:uncharacterized protein YcaQ